MAICSSTAFLQSTVVAVPPGSWAADRGHSGQEDVEDSIPPGLSSAATSAARESKAERILDSQSSWREESWNTAPGSSYQVCQKADDANAES